LARIIPGAGLARNPKFEVNVRFQWVKPSEPATRGGGTVEIPSRAIGLESHDATEIELVVVAGPVH
jgi:hypothetical protein